jgi:putrescine importer
MDGIRYLLLPLIGAAFTMWLWSHLEMEALILGGIWMACGFTYLVYMTKWFRKPLPEFHFDKEMILENVQDIDQEVIPQQLT